MNLAEMSDRISELKERRDAWKADRYPSTLLWFEAFPEEAQELIDLLEARSYTVRTGV